MTTNINMTENVMNIFKAWVDESGFDIDESSLSNLSQKVNELIASEQKLSKSTKKTKSIKDPDAPKRGKSAYIYFCNANREIVKNELGNDLKTTEITKELGARWNKLKESTKAADKKLVAAYEQQAKQDKERYDGEMQGYERPSDDELEEKTAKKGKNGKVKKVKDPSAPKRGKSAYIFFCADMRDTVRSELGNDSKATEVTKELGVRWNKLKESTKASDKKLLTKYEKMATNDKDRYEKEKSDASSGDESDKVKQTKKPSVKKPKKKEEKEEEEVSDEDELEEEDE
jgi:DNA-directed RNA polymerase specialized sigma subunit